MSLFKYSSPTKPQSTNACRNASTAVANMLNRTEPATSGLTRNEVTLVMEELNSIARSDSRRQTYNEEEKKRVAWYAAENGISAAVRHFSREFPKLRHTTIIPWVKEYEQMLRDPLVTTIGVKCGRPTYLSAELDQNVRAMIINLRIYVVKDVLAGLIRFNITKNGAFLDFLLRGLGPVALWTNEIFSASINNEQANDHTFSLRRGKRAIPTQYCLQSQWS